MFNRYLSSSLPPLLLFVPSILLSSTTFMVSCWQQTLVKWSTLLQFKHFEFIALHCKWFGLKGKPPLLHFVLLLFCFWLLFFFMLQYEYEPSLFIAATEILSSPATAFLYFMPFWQSSSKFQFFNIALLHIVSLFVPMTIWSP